jgi:hypothetical protein
MKHSVEDLGLMIVEVPEKFDGSYGKVVFRLLLKV